MRGRRTRQGPRADGPGHGVLGVALVHVLARRACRGARGGASSRWLRSSSPGPATRTTPVAAATPAPAANDGTQSAEELQAEFDEGDRRQIEDLTTQAKSIAEQLHVSRAGSRRRSRDAATCRSRSPTTRCRSGWTPRGTRPRPLSESISGGTGHNVGAARCARPSTGGLATAIATYRLAGEPGADREAIPAQAKAQRDNAIRTWSAASIQIDAINVDAGFGHQHVARLAARPPAPSRPTPPP